MKNNKNNKNKINNSFIHKYAYFMSHHPFIVLLITLIITISGIFSYGMIKTKSLDVDEILPSTLPVTQALYKLNDNLGGGESTAFMVVIELDPNEGSNINDIRDPKIIKYIDLISNQIMNIEDITGTTSLASQIDTLNKNQPINSLNEVKKYFIDSPNTFARTVNDKYSLTVIRIKANQDFNVGFLQHEVQKVIDNTPKPTGIKIQLAGEEIARNISKELTGPDSSKTTTISLIAIIIILLITFRSIIYSLLPLFTIIFGVMWTFAFIAISGIQMSSFTAGAISMIVGIGIDFGIQTIMRFKQELAISKANPVLALQRTLENVFKPMFITTLAASIGFWSMTMGDFLVLGELGKIMTIGVIYCFLSAVTVVPAISVIWEKYKPKKKLNSPIKVILNFLKLITGNAKL